MLLDNRELASVIWLAVAFLVILSQEKLRRGVTGILRSALAPVIFVPLLAMVTYGAFEAWIGWKASRALLSR